MDIKKDTVHQLIISSRIREKELYRLIADHIAVEAGITINQDDKIYVHLDKVDKGVMGFEYEANITIKQDISGDDG